MKSNFVPASGVWAKFPNTLKAFVGISATLLVVAGIIEAICWYVLRLGAPYNSPLLFERFPDLLTLQPRFQHFHTLQFFLDRQDAPCMYPAPIAVCYRALFAFSPHELAALITLAVLSFTTAATLLGRSLIHHGMTLTTAFLFLGFTLVTSYPLWFEIKQANLEIFSWIFVALGLWAFMHRREYSAGACFGVAGALKILPFIYLGMFLSKRKCRYGPILTGVMAAAVVTLPSLWLVYPHIGESWRLTGRAVAQFRSVVTLNIYPQIGFDHSIFGAIKRVVFSHITADRLSQLLTVYSALATAFMLVIFFVRIRHLPVINQVLCLCVATLIVPPTSFDYTLMSLYFPWALLVLLVVRNEKAARNSPGLLPAMACFAILFTPETEIILRTKSLGGQVKALALAILFLIALRHPFAPEETTKELSA